jgi:hypothetical protein
MSAGTIPRSQSVNYPQGRVEAPHGTPLNAKNVSETFVEPDWMRIGVGATLLTGSLLLLTGKRKAGLLVTAAGTALAMLEHKELVRELFDTLPGYLERAQSMLDQAASTVEDLNNKREKIMSLLGR